jgi:putative transposase
VSRASFYRHWEQKAPSAAEMALREAIQRAALKHRYYGYRRIAVLIEREGFHVGAKKVRRLMREDNLLAVRRRKFVVITDSDHPFCVYPNLSQHLVLSDINQLWVADLTYVRLLEEFVYLAVVLDAWSRRAIGWALGRSLDSQLPLLALGRAIASRQPQPGLVHHSDRGSQYASVSYVGRLEAIGAVLSMSRPGRPWENGVCESFLTRSNGKRSMRVPMPASKNSNSMWRSSWISSTTGCACIPPWATYLPRNLKRDQPSRKARRPGCRRV